MNLAENTKVKYKIKLLVTATVIINIILILLFISLSSGQSKSEEIFNCYLKESKINASDKLYISKETENSVNDGNIENNENSKTSKDSQNNENEELVKENYPTGEEKYYIKVNCEAQTVTIYEKDENGYYSVPTKVMLCSTGTNTPQTGIYKITSFKREWLALQGRSIWSILYTNYWRYIIPLSTIFRK